MSRARPAVAGAIAALLLSGCGVDPRTEADAAPSIERGAVLRFVTWNVHDLFDEQDRTVPPGEQDEVPSPAEVAAKIEAVGRVLARIDADVIALQEVENEALLERLIAGPLRGRGYRAFLREGYDPRGIDVGILSRLPFEPGPSHLDDRAPDGRRIWSRDLVQISLSGQARSVVVFAAHLLSRLDPANDARRSLQATRLREFADAAVRDRSSPVVVIVGDLNDLPDSPALAPLLADGSYVDLGGGVPVTSAWTWSGGGLRERMDYALIARRDAGLVIRAAVDGGSDVAAASDHRPLGLDVWLPPRDP